MNTKNLQKHYDKLTARERYAAMVAANQRGDNQELAALAQSAPRIVFSVTDAYGLSRAFEFLAAHNHIMRLGYAALLFSLPLNDGRQADVTEAFLAQVTRRILAERAAWQAICAEYGIDAELFLPHSGIIARAEALVDEFLGEDADGEDAEDTIGEYRSAIEKISSPFMKG